MYKIYSQGKLIALCDEPRYIKEKDGVFVGAKKEDAAGIAVGGEVYNLAGQVLKQNADEAIVVKEDSGLLLFETKQGLDEAQAVNSICFVTMAESEELDDVTITEHADLFSLWCKAIDYAVGDIRRHEGKLYRCVQAHKSQADWTPDAVASLWSQIGDPAEEFPEWSQPIGAHDAYMQGDKVSYCGKHYISEIDNNVWSPDAYGWAEA
jgi:hypothetical protein